MRQTLAGFIEAHRDEIDEAINRALNHVPRQASCSCPKSGTDHMHDDPRELDDDEREQWVMNDEGLYSWARSEGMREDDEDEDDEDDDDDEDANCDECDEAADDDDDEEAKS